MTSSLVEQLQLDACNPEVPVSNLLRKALLVASRLEIPGAPEWINAELSGYSNANDVPSYRRLRGRAMARGLRGWLPVQFPTSDLQELVDKQNIHQPISELETLAPGDGELSCSYPPEIVAHLQQLTHEDTDFRCFISRAAVSSVIDEVRNRLLRWSIELYDAGIRGEGVLFTRDEKQKAHPITIQGANVNIGAIGDVGAHANIAAGAGAKVASIVAADLRQLIGDIEPYVSKLALQPGEERDLRQALAELQSEANRPQIVATKVQRLLARVMELAGKGAAVVIKTGIEAVVKGWLAAHGIGTP